MAAARRNQTQVSATSIEQGIQAASGKNDKIIYK